tara:strand:+ start:389 stop:1057 length:669 start_codon:yes stop_codon:yes gene_type:complete
MKIVIANSKNWFSLKKTIEEKNNILFIKNSNDLKLSTLKEFKPNLILFPHWSNIVSEKIVEKYKCILFHTAPLPYGRGGSPIQNLILKGFTKTPVCALKMTNSLDSGPIYMTKIISLNGNLDQIFKRLNKVVNEIIEELINNLPKPKEQIGESYLFKRLTSNENEIKKSMSISEIYDHIRMVDHEDYDKAYISFGKYKISFSKAELLKNKINAKVTILFDRK